MTLQRLRKLIFLHLQHLPMPSKMCRPLIAKWGGVNVEDVRNTFIGEDVVFDTNYPEEITIESGSTITIGTIIITHFVEIDDALHRHYSKGSVTIRKGAYVGARTIICKSVEIGEYAIVGAGSVVTKDIPSGEVWAGNPARFIKKR